MGSIGGWNQQPPATELAETQYENAKISVWWDIENCEVPNSSDPHFIAQNITSALVKVKYCGPVSISSYGDTNRLPSSVQQALNSTGIALNHVPAGAKDASDKKILVDMLLWAVDNPAPANYLLISGDRDFSNALHQLRMRRYNIILAQPTNASAPLVAAARSVWLWTTLCAGGPPLSKDDASQLVRTHSNSSSVTDTPRKNYTDSSFDGSKPGMDSFPNNGRTFDIKQKGKQSKMNNGFHPSTDSLLNDGRPFDAKQKGKQNDGSDSSSDSLSSDGRTFDTKQKVKESRMDDASNSSTDSLSNDGKTSDTKQKGQQSWMNGGGQKETPIRAQDSKTNTNLHQSGHKNTTQPKKPEEFTHPKKDRSQNFTSGKFSDRPWNNTINNQNPHQNHFHHNVGPNNINTPLSYSSHPDPLGNSRPFVPNFTHGHGPQVSMPEVGRVNISGSPRGPNFKPCSESKPVHNNFNQTSSHANAPYPPYRPVMRNRSFKHDSPKKNMRPNGPEQQPLSSASIDGKNMRPNGPEQQPLSSASIDGKNMHSNGPEQQPSSSASIDGNFVWGTFECLEPSEQQPSEQRPSSSSSIDSNIASGTFECTKPSEYVMGQIGVILLALDTLKTEKIMPTESNLTDCIRYGDSRHRNTDVKKAIESAFELQFVVKKSPAPNLQLYFCKNDELWDYVNLYSGKKYSPLAWVSVKKFLLTSDGRSRILASECKYEAATIIKRMCLKDLFLGEILHIVHLMVYAKKWITHNPSGWQPLNIQLEENSRKAPDIVGAQA